MFQLSVKGRDLKNLLSLHNKHLATIVSLRENIEKEGEIEDQKEAEAVAQLPPHLRGSVVGGGVYPQPLSISRIKQSPAQRELANYTITSAIAKNQWLLEQVKDDEMYTLDQKDLVIFGLTGMVQVHGIHPLTPMI